MPKLPYAAVLLLVGSVAVADPSPQTVDVTAVLPKLRLLSHPTYGYIAVVADNAGDFMFYSLDGKTFYQQRLNNRYWASDEDWSVGFWSPRAATGLADGGRIERDKASGKVLLRCGKVTEPWQLMPAVEGAKLAAAAMFKSRLWARQAHFLARDDRGVYVYIDRLQEAFGGKGHRIFRGPKGAMKPLKMTNIVSDSEGEVYSTKGGELRLVSGTGKAAWIAGKRQVALTIVPVADNVAMIYRDLGVYPGDLGTPCDIIAR